MPKKACGNPGAFPPNYVWVILHRPPAHIGRRDTGRESEQIEPHRTLSRIEARVCTRSESLRSIDSGGKQRISERIGCRSVWLKRERAVLGTEHDRIERRRKWSCSERETQIERRCQTTPRPHRSIIRAIRESAVVSQDRIDGKDRERESRRRVDKVAFPRPGVRPLCNRQSVELRL